MINITLQFNSYEEAIATLRGIASGIPVEIKPAPAKAEAAAAKAIEKAAKVEAPKPAAAEKPAVAPAGATAAVAPAPASSTPEVTYDDVAALVIKFSKANGRPAAVEALKPFGITALTQAKPEQFAAIASAFASELESV